jgi:hypothetical protein
MNLLVLVFHIFKRIDPNLIFNFFQIWDFILIFGLGKQFSLQLKIKIKLDRFDYWLNNLWFQKTFDSNSNILKPIDHLGLWL